MDLFIIDHLQYQPATLHACCLVSEILGHFSVRTEFNPLGRHVKQWRETFPNPTNSPANVALYTRKPTPTCDTIGWQSLSFHYLDASPLPSPHFQALLLFPRSLELGVDILSLEFNASDGKEYIPPHPLLDLLNALHLIILSVPWFSDQEVGPTKG
ncbi:hypothetical protein BJ322DRAFT_1112245 [Thelephora terrestris]|uniref:Uncharacterized protein n=1 Tax=Thelephora terrestris TaxID=56493 RepID=A0A9P6H7L8_9AGAM|nr:hypothetical protein BJ322DRAFT_1112245 [Thelephora terrestris]